MRDLINLRNPLAVGRAVMLCASIIAVVNAMLLIVLSQLEACRTFTEMPGNIDKVTMVATTAAFLILGTINIYRPAEYTKLLEMHNNPAWNIRAFAHSVPITMKHLMFDFPMVAVIVATLAFTAWSIYLLYGIVNYCVFS